MRLSNKSRCELKGKKSWLRKSIYYSVKRISEYWNTHSGDWHWLEEKTMPIASINRHVWRISVPSFSFHFLLGISGIISTLGLLANSVAVIIGAMIIAPLMGPIIGIAYAMAMGNRRLLRRSMLTVFTGVALTILIAYISTIFSGWKTVGGEITARANPTLLDLGLALAAGSAGAFANSRRRIADALPGVAIAVALVPPLSVIGIGLGLGKESLSVGALLLFLTNLTGIVFSGGVVFLLQNYGNIKKAQRGLLISTIILVLLGLPLGFSLNRLLIKQQVRQSVLELVNRRTITFSGSDVRSISVQPRKGQLFIELEVAAPLGSISKNQVDLVKEFLEKQLEEDIVFTVRVVPVDIFKSALRNDGYGVGGKLMVNCRGLASLTSTASPAP